MAEFAFVFPGQGSQSVGMLDAWGDHAAVRDTLAEASAALGSDIGQLIHEGPKELLDLTTNTQIVMMVSAVACYRAWRAEGGAEPSAVAGHSLGEYSALVAAGAMVAVLGLDGAEVVKACEQAAAGSGEIVSAANFNEPKQTVIAGSKAGVAAASEVLKGLGAKRLLPLAVSAPFHCALMKPAADRLKERLLTTAIATPRCAVVNNIDVAVETDPERIRDALYRQAFGPVRWVEVVQALRARGVAHIVECGPGRVLSKIVARIAPEVGTTCVLDPASLAQAKEMLA